MRDSVNRALRTFIQAFAGSLAYALPGVAVTTDYPALASTLIGLGIAAVIAGLTAVCALAQNTLEDIGAIKDRR